MIEIYIDNKLVELDNTNISLQKEFSDEVENITTDIEYSYTISLPTSLNNKEIFGFVDTFDVGNKFARIYNAELYVDNTLILSGKFKMTSIEDGHFKGNLYNPKKKTISDILGDRQLNEIKPHMKPMNSMGDFDATNNYVAKLTTDGERLSGITIWDDVEGVADNHVIYPYVLYGLPMNIAEENLDLDIYTQNLEYGKHSISENNVFPAFNVTSILKDMFATEGYNLVGNIFSNEIGNYFSKLYQTFQYSYDDYVQKKEAPFSCRVVGKYCNLSHDFTSISKTLQATELWSVDEFGMWDGDDVEHDGKFIYGVDNPWSTGGKNNRFDKIIDDKHMFTKGSIDENTGILIIPKSGWYKIKLKGKMKYPFAGSSYIMQEEKENVGGTTDEADNTDLSEQPFELQLKKGTPAESPKLYSFNSFIPCVPTAFINDRSVVYDGADTYIRIEDKDSQRRYGKNGKTTYVKNYSDFSTSDFVCGVRLGGAWFSGDWGAAARGGNQRPNRFMTMGAGLALPDPTKTVRIKEYNDENVSKRYKTGVDPLIDGRYFQICQEDNNKNFEYAEKTAQCLVKYGVGTEGSYSNFEGYNTLSTGGTWDTTSDYGKVTYEGAENSTAATTSKYEGSWDVNTVVWLEEGDTLYLEALIPYHTGGSYRDSGLFRHSKWENRASWINMVDIDYDLQVGFLNSKNDWSPKTGDGIEEWESLYMLKLTNVNQFLPTIKCNDYLEKFLKTFNLQLTTVNANTFSIDSNVNMNMATNVIDIDKLVNVADAEFKPLKSDSVKQLCWKNDLSETGYVQGNQSPYKAVDLPWYNSGYTGNYTFTNETNTSGSVKKIESQWSYNWYKDIRFINSIVQTSVVGYEQEHPPYTGVTAVSVISDSDIWKDGSSYYSYSNEKPKTTKTSRLFFLADGGEQHYLPPYITFVYDQVQINLTDAWGRPLYKNLLCNLIIPSNSLGVNFLDYNKDGINAINTDNTFIGKSITEKFFNEKMNGGYDIEVPIKLTNQQYADVTQGTLFKLNDGLFKTKSIEGHDVNMEDDATLTITTIE